MRSPTDTSTPPPRSRAKGTAGSKLTRERRWKNRDAGQRLGRFVEHHFGLFRGRLVLLWFRDACDEFGPSTCLVDSTGGLARGIRFPVSVRIFVWRIENRPLEEGVRMQVDVSDFQSAETPDFTVYGSPTASTALSRSIKPVAAPQLHRLAAKGRNVQRRYRVSIMESWKNPSSPERNAAGPTATGNSSAPALSSSSVPQGIPAKSTGTRVPLMGTAFAPRATARSASGATRRVIGLGGRLAAGPLLRRVSKDGADALTEG